MASTLNTILEHCSMWIVAYLPAIFSAISSMLITFFIGIYDEKSILKTIAGSFICGIFTLAVSGSLEHLGLQENSVNLIGGIIGFVGVEQIRKLIESKINRRLGAGTNENQ